MIAKQNNSQKEELKSFDYEKSIKVNKDTSNYIKYNFSDNLKLLKHSERLDSCSSTLVTRKGIYETVYTPQNTCKLHLLCEICARKKSEKDLSRIRVDIETLLMMCKHLGIQVYPYMVTLTTPPHENLETSFTSMDNIVKSVFASVRRSKSKNNREKKFADAKFMSDVIGYVGQFEIKLREYKKSGKLYYNSNGNLEYYSHFHALIFSSKLLPITSDYKNKKSHPLSKEVSKYTSGNSFITDVRPIMNSDISDILESASEVIKYVVKPNDTIPMKNKVAIHEYLSGKKLLRRGGKMLRLDKVKKSAIKEENRELAEMENFHYATIYSSKYDYKKSLYRDTFTVIENLKFKPFDNSDYGNLYFVVSPNIHIKCACNYQDYFALLFNIKVRRDCFIITDTEYLNQVKRSYNQSISPNKSPT